MVARLIHSAITSLDGYVADESGNFDWAAPDEAVHRFVNELERSVGTYLYGRRMYEVMAVWQTLDANPQSAEYERDYARLWQAAEKVVYSTSLAEPLTPRTRIEREFDAESVRRMKAESASDISISGPTLAAHAVRAGLIDEIQMFIAPVVIGGGLRFLPEGSRLGLKLLDEHRFSNGVVYLRYDVRSG